MSHGQWGPERRPQGQHVGDDRGRGRQCRPPGPAPRGPRRPVLERRPREVSSFAETRGRPGRDVSVLRTAWTPLAGSPLLPASRLVPLPSSAPLLALPSPSCSLPAPRAAPKPQGHGGARPPAFLPCFHSGDVPQNTQPAGGSSSLGGPLGMHLKALAGPGPPGPPNQRLAGGRSRDEPAGRTGAAGQARRETSGMWRRGADTHTFLLPGSPLAGTVGRGREPGPGDTARRRSRGWLGSGALPWSPGFPPPPGVLLTGRSSPRRLPHSLCPAFSSAGSLHRMAREGQVLLWARWAAGHRGARRPRAAATVGQLWPGCPVGAPLPATRSQPRIWL